MTSDDVDVRWRQAVERGSLEDQEEVHLHRPGPVVDMETKQQFLIDIINEDNKTVSAHPV